MPLFERMHDLFVILNTRRKRRGSIDFDLPEAEVVMDESGLIEDIIAAERNVAHRLIEEFMLLANETVAEFISENEGPALYRVHEQPDLLKVAQFEEFIGGFGYSLAASASAIRPQALPAPAREDPRYARGTAHSVSDAAHDAEGALRAVESRALRPGGRELHPLHVANPPLPGPGRAPPAPRDPAR